MDNRAEFLTEFNAFCAYIDNEVENISSDLLLEADLAASEIKRLFKAAEETSNDSDEGINDKARKKIDALIDRVYQGSQSLKNRIKSTKVSKEAKSELNDVTNEIEDETEDPVIQYEVKALKRYMLKHPMRLIFGLGILSAIRSLLKRGHTGEAKYALSSLRKKKKTEGVEDDPAITEGVISNFTNKISDIADDIITGQQVRKVKQNPTTSDKDITYKRLADAWMRNNRPTDSNQIIKILKKEGLSNSQIKRAFRDAGVPISFKRDDIIIKLSEIIRKHKMQDVVLQHLEKDHGINVSEVSEELITESVITEEVLSDKEIRAIFSKLVQTTQGNKKSQKELNDHIKNWAKELNTADSKNEKISLVKEIVNILADRKNHPEWESVVKTAENVIKKATKKHADTKSNKLDPKFASKAISNIKSGQIMESTRYLLATYLLSECYLTWSDLSLKPRKIDENYYRVDQVVGDRAILIEEFFQDIVAYNRISQYGKEI